MGGRTRPTKAEHAVDLDTGPLVAVTLQGLTTREVSERASIPHGTVKTRVRLALRKLRDEMGVPVE